MNVYEALLKLQENELICGVEMQPYGAMEVWVKETTDGPKDATTFSVMQQDEAVQWLNRKAKQYSARLP